MKFENKEFKDKKVNVSILSNVKDHIVDVNDYLALKIIAKLEMELYDKDFPESFKGIAICDDEDNYDSNKGRMIAENKASMKYHKAMIRRYTKYINALYKIISILEKRSECHTNKLISLGKKNIALGYPEAKEYKD
jgi:hypothetical protein